ncbi:MAG: hypothetical protein ABIF88_00690 [archaeon]
MGLTRKIIGEVWDFLSGDVTREKIREFRSEDFESFEQTDIKSRNKWYSFGDFLDSLNSVYDFWMPLEKIASGIFISAAMYESLTNTDFPIESYLILSLSKGFIYTNGLLSRKRIKSAREYIGEKTFEIYEGDREFLKILDEKSKKGLSKYDKVSYAWIRNTNPGC